LTKIFKIPKNVRPTARKISVQPTQIRTWKRKLPTGTGISTATPEGEILQGKRFKKEGQGLRSNGGKRKCALSKDVIDKLQVFYDSKRFADLGVTLRLMTAECRLLDPSVCSLSSNALEGRVYRLLVKWDASWRCGTHKAQNTRHDAVVMNEFRSYVRMKARILGVDCQDKT
jgi:hypothetical protein